MPIRTKCRAKPEGAPSRSEGRGGGLTRLRVTLDSRERRRTVRPPPFASLKGGAPAQPTDDAGFSALLADDPEACYTDRKPKFRMLCGSI